MMSVAIYIRGRYSFWFWTVILHLNVLNSPELGLFPNPFKRLFTGNASEPEKEVLWVGRFWLGPALPQAPLPSPWRDKVRGCKSWGLRWVKRALNQDISQTNHRTGEIKPIIQREDMHPSKRPSEKMKADQKFLKCGPRTPATKIPTVFLKKADFWGPPQASWIWILRRKAGFCVLYQSSADLCSSWHLRIAESLR